jgi:hypothetical protein
MWTWLASLKISRLAVQHSRSSVSSGLTPLAYSERMLQPTGECHIRKMDRRTSMWRCETALNDMYQ